MQPGVAAASPFATLLTLARFIVVLCGLQALQVRWLAARRGRKRGLSTDRQRKKRSHLSLLFGHRILLSQ